MKHTRNIMISISDFLNEESFTFLLYNKVLNKPIGYIGFSLYPSIDSYTVGGVYSLNGYGSFLYESAMTYVYPNGLSMSRDSTTSDDALGVI